MTRFREDATFQRAAEESLAPVNGELSSIDSEFAKGKGRLHDVPVLAGGFKRRLRLIAGRAKLIPQARGRHSQSALKASSVRLPCRGQADWTGRCTGRWSDTVRGYNRDGEFALAS